MANIEEKKLTNRERKKLPKSSFVYPEDKRYPVNDLAHARNALARVSAHGTTAEQSRVKSVVRQKFPEIKIGESMTEQDIQVTVSECVAAAIGVPITEFQAACAPEPPKGPEPKPHHPVQSPADPADGADPEKAYKDKKAKEKGEVCAPEPAEKAVPALKVGEPSDGAQPAKSFNEATAVVSKLLELD